MELQGKVIAVLPEKTGTSARGEWKVQEYVIETHDAYPKKMVFSVFGADRIQRFNIQAGQEVTVAFDIDAHEYNGRWFNSIRAFDVRQVDPASVGMQPGVVPGTAFGPTPAAAPAQPTASTATAQPAAPAAEQNSEDDLPF